MEEAKQNIVLYVVVAILALGMIAGLLLSMREQDIRQQASTTRQENYNLLDTVGAPSDAQKIGAESTLFSGKPEYTGQWSTSSSVYAVAQHYLTSLPTNGWTITESPTDSPLATQQFISATKDNRVAHITIRTREVPTAHTEIMVEIPVTVDANLTSTEPVLPILESTKSADVERYAFYANTGIGPNFDQLLSLVKKYKVDVVVHLGGFDLEQNPNLFAQKITNALGKDPLYLYVVGDQDAGSADTWRNGCSAETGCYANHLLSEVSDAGLQLTFPPGSSLSNEEGFDAYALRKGNVHIVSLGLGDFDPADTGIATRVYAPFIAETFKTTDAIWKICAFHEGVFSMQVASEADSMGWDVYKACRRAGAMIMVGDGATYSRTKTIANFELQQASTVSPYSNRLQLQPGLSFLATSGLGGSGKAMQHRCRPLTEPYGCNEEWATIYTASQRADYGTLIIDFPKDQTFPESSGQFVTTQNKTIDTFTITQTQEFVADSNEPSVLSAQADECGRVFPLSAYSRSAQTTLTAQAQVCP